MHSKKIKKESSGIRKTPPRQELHWSHLRRPTPHPPVTHRPRERERRYDWGLLACGQVLLSAHRSLIKDTGRDSPYSLVSCPQASEACTCPSPSSIPEHLTLGPPNLNQHKIDPAGLSQMYWVVPIRPQQRAQRSGPVRQKPVTDSNLLKDLVAGPLSVLGP